MGSKPKRNIELSRQKPQPCFFFYENQWVDFMGAAISTAEYQLGRVWLNPIIN
jgi:hypothetical protein